MMEQFKVIQRSRDYPSICWDIQNSTLITGCPEPSLNFIGKYPVEGYCRMDREVDRTSSRLSTPETFHVVEPDTDFPFLSPLEDPEPFSSWTRFGYGASYYIKAMSQLAYDRFEERFGSEAFCKFLDTPYQQMLSDCDAGPQAIYELKGEAYERFISSREEFQHSHDLYPFEYSHLRFMLMPNEVARQYCEQILMVMGMVYGPSAEQKYIEKHFLPADQPPPDWRVECDLAFCKAIVEDGWHMLVAQPMMRKRDYAE